MLTIYGADLSSPANKVRFVANALGLAYEYKRVRIREGENRREEYLKIHPAGKVPAIVDDGFALFESDAICKYLCAKQSSPLYPSGLKERALVDQWVDFVTIHIGGAVSKVLFNRVFAKVIGVPVDENSLSDGLKFLDRFLPVVERQLGKNTYLTGGELSLADFDLLAQLDPCEAAGIDLTAYPKIANFRKKLQQQDFYKKCHDDYASALKRVAEVMKK